MQMKRNGIIYIILLLVAVLFFILIICLLNSTNKYKEREFYFENEYITDGMVRYIYLDLPDHWKYHSDFRIRIGHITKGNSIYASDQTEMFIRETKNWYQDMENNTMVRTDFALPDKYEASRATITKKMSKEIELSDDAFREFMIVYRELMDKKELLSQFDYSIINNDNTIKALVRFQYDEFSGLTYECEYNLYFYQEHLYLFSEEYDDYKEIKQNTLLYNSLSSILNNS